MNHLKKNPVGIDVVINSVQKELYDMLVEKWDCKVKGFGRAYKNISDNGKIIPEVYAQGDDYEEVYFDDEFSCIFFFLDNDTHKTNDEVLFESETKVVFMTNLEGILGKDCSRNDDKAHLDAVSILREISDDRYNIKSIETGIKNVFRGLFTENIKFDDLHPNHVFAITTNLSYYLTDKCT